MQKYVIVNLITPVIFSVPLSHRDMLKLGKGNATSGAYFVLDGCEVVVGGVSMSTDLKIGPHDAEILQRFLDEAVVSTGAAAAAEKRGPKWARR